MSKLISRIVIHFLFFGSLWWSSVHLAKDFFYKTPPSWVKGCNLADKPNLADCQVEAFQMMVDELFTKGFPELKLMTGDPLKIDKIEIGVGDNGPIRLDLILENISLEGLKNTKTLANSFNKIDGKYTWMQKVIVPDVHFRGKYTAKGQVLVVPINGHGDTWFNLKNLTIDFKTSVNLYEKDSMIFENIEKFGAKYNIGDLKFELGNLFEGNPELSHNITQYLGNNWREVAEAVEPLLQDTFQTIFELYLARVIKAVPLEYWLPDFRKVFKYNP